MFCSVHYARRARVLSVSRWVPRSVWDISTPGNAMKSRNPWVRNPASLRERTCWPRKFTLLSWHRLDLKPGQESEQLHMRAVGPPVERMMTPLLSVCHAPVTEHCVCVVPIQRICAICIFFKKRVSSFISYVCDAKNKTKQKRTPKPKKKEKRTKIPKARGWGEGSQTNLNRLLAKKRRKGRNHNCFSQL